MIIFRQWSFWWLVIAMPGACHCFFSRLLSKWIAKPSLVWSGKIVTNRTSVEEYCYLRLKLSNTFRKRMGFFLIAMNSVRIFSAEQVIDQVKVIITSIRQEHRYFNEPESITIASTFPCLKLTKRFSTERKMMRNIDSYNQRLRSLSSEMHFQVLDFHLTVENLGRDCM